MRSSKAVTIVTIFDVIFDFNDKFLNDAIVINSILQATFPQEKVYMVPIWILAPIKQINN